MRQSTQAILSYWKSIANEGVPAKSAIDPRALKTVLPDLFILERMDRSLFAFRLAGTRLCARYGRELRDHDFVRLWPSSQQGDILAHVNTCLRSAEPVSLSGDAVSLDGEAVPFEILLMPIRDADGRVNALLGAMIFADHGQFAKGSVVTAQRLTGVHGPRENGVHDAAGASEGFSTGRRTHVPHLRVVSGGKDERLAGKGTAANGQHSLAG